MPVDQKKTVQTVLTQKTKNKDTASSKEKPPSTEPANKKSRHFSQVDEASIDNIDLASIHADLCEIKTTLQDSITKQDLDSAVEGLVKKSELNEIVTNIVSQLLNTLKDEYNTKLKEATDKLQDHVDNLFMENNSLKEKLHEKDKLLKQLVDTTEENNIRSKDALKQSNYNEQYSRKNNIRILNLPEKQGENLHEMFPQLIKSELKEEITQDDIIGIHRIPGREGMIKPVIVKLRNNTVKRQIMRKKKELKNNLRFYDDISHRNLGLMTRLRQSQKLNSVWFFNCSVYGQKEEGGKRIKFDLFDDIEERIKRFHH